MLPTLVPGETVTALRRWRKLRDGDVVVVQSPADGRWIIKRCHLTSPNTVRLLGDNAQFSTDSREFGDLAARDVRWILWSSSIPPRQK